MPLRFRALHRGGIRSRSTRVTVGGLLFLLFSLAVGVAAINTGNNLFYLLLAMMLSIILVSGLVAEHGLRRLQFHRHVPTLLFVKEPATVTLVVKNDRTRCPSFSLRFLEVVDGDKVDHALVVHQLDPGAVQMLSYVLSPRKRGRLNFEGVCVVTSFPFGLFAKTAYYPLRDTAVACPVITPLDDGLLHDAMTRGHEHHAHRRGSGNQLYNLRLYQSGDDSRNIHWISTAKTSQLIVRETEAEEQRRVTIHLDTVVPATHDDVFEQAVSFAASLVSHLSRRGYQLRLAVGSSSFGGDEMDPLALFQNLALCERLDPGTSTETADNPLVAAGAEEEELILSVRPWNGRSVHGAGGSTVIFTSDMFVKDDHVIG